MFLHADAGEYIPYCYTVIRYLVRNSQREFFLLLFDFELRAIVILFGLVRYENIRGEKFPE